MSRPAERGFSLVEVLLVLLVVAVALLPLTGVQMGSRRAVGEAQRRAEAVRLAQTELERLRALGFGRAGADSVQREACTVVSEVVPEIDPLSGQPLDSVERLRVRVRWIDQGDTLRVQLSGLRAARQ